MSKQLHRQSSNGRTDESNISSHSPCQGADSPRRLVSSAQLEERNMVIQYPEMPSEKELTGKSLLSYLVGQNDSKLNKFERNDVRFVQNKNSMNR